MTKYKILRIYFIHLEKELNNIESGWKLHSVIPLDLTSGMYGVIISKDSTKKNK